MENFKEVSLGFAEFISQLIQETFEAMISAKNYQFEKYSELERILNFSNNKFIEEFVSSNQIDERMLDYFGFNLKSQMTVTSDLQIFLIEKTEITNGLFVNDKLTNIGYEAIRDFVSELLVEEKKAVISNLINNSSSVNLIVESGQINAKIELSNLYSYNETESIKGSEVTKSSFNKSLKPEGKDINEKEIFQQAKKPMKVSEIIDNKTNKTTLIIDKSEIIQASKSSLSIPSLRLVALPVKMNSSSNLYAEVTLNFKLL